MTLSAQPSSTRCATEIEQQARHLKQAVIIKAEESVILRSRAWGIGMGFAPDPTKIPPLNQ